MPGISPHDGAMIGGLGARRYGTPVHQTRCEGIDEVWDLTVSRQEGSAASREGSKGAVDDGGGWRERSGTRVRGNLIKSRPKHEIGVTYGRGETRQSSRARRRRGSRCRSDGL